MMMPWGGDAAWMGVVGVVVGLAMLTTAVWLIRAMFRRPAPDPHPSDAPDDSYSPYSPSSPESRAARGEMDLDQLHLEQHDLGRRGSGTS